MKIYRKWNEKKEWDKTKRNETRLISILSKPIKVLVVVAVIVLVIFVKKSLVKKKTFPKNIRSKSVRSKIILGWKNVAKKIKV